MKTIKMIEFGTVLANRKEARELFNQCEKLNFDVTFDFEWVKLMNSSFADELFAKAIILWKKFKIKNIDDFSKKMIIFTVESRKKHPNLELA